MRVTHHSPDNATHGCTVTQFVNPQAVCVTRFDQQQAVVYTMVLATDKREFLRVELKKIVLFQEFQPWQLKMFSGRIKEKYRLMCGVKRTSDVRDHNLRY